MALAIEALHPGAEQPADYVVENDSDGRGQRLAYWNADVLGPAPTEEHLEQGWRMHLKNQRRAEILSRLSAIDLETVRPLRAVTAGAGTEYDTTKLAALEVEAKELRDELAKLG